MANRMPFSQRRGHDILLRLTPEERRQLDAEVDRYGVETQSYLRTLIQLAHRGQIRVPDSAFDHQL